MNTIVGCEHKNVHIVHYSQKWKTGVCSGALVIISICSYTDLLTYRHCWSVSWVINRTTVVKVRVKCTVVQVLRLCTGCTVHWGSRGIGKGKVHRCTGTEALYRLYGPLGE